MFRKRFIAVSFLLGLPFSVATSAKEWRGIVPMHSNRADVERRLGKPSDGTYYDFEDERVQIVYVEKPCESTGPSPGFNVPAGTVSQIRVFFKKEKRKADLRIDEAKFIKTKEEDTDWHYYWNGDEGIMYIISEPEWEKNGIVGQAIYSAAANDEYLRCSEKSKRRARPRRTV